MDRGQDNLKNAILDEIESIQRTLSKDDVTLKDLAKALSFFIRINTPAIETEFVAKQELEVRLQHFRQDCPVHAQYLKDKAVMESIPALRALQLLKDKSGWIFGVIVLIASILTHLGLIHFGK